LYPGVQTEQVKAGVGWPLRVRTTLLEVPPPGPRELAVLREDLDPQQLFLKG
jgi:glutaconate CoA-transferase subunit B